MLMKFVCFDYGISLWEGTVRGFLHYSPIFHHVAVQYLKPVSVNSYALC